MKTFVLRLNPDTRGGKPYSAYPSVAEYNAIHAQSPMNGFHEAINFLPENGIVKGYLPPKHAAALRTGEPFALITITAKTAKTGADQLIGFQVGCVYHGESQRTNVPKQSEKLGLIWHFRCPASMSLLLTTPIAGARELVVGMNSNWIRHPTTEISNERFLQCLEAAHSQAPASERNAIKRLQTVLLRGLPQPVSEAEMRRKFESEVLAALSANDGTPPGGNPHPKQIATGSTQFVRDPAVAAYVLRMAKGICGDCRQRGPFISKATGMPYLEVHHKKLLANGGPDTIENVIALCPNCHRKRHYGVNEA